MKRVMRVAAASVLYFGLTFDVLAVGRRIPQTWRLGDVVRSASKFGFSNHRRKRRTRQDAFMKDRNRGAHALLHYVAI